MAQARPSSWVFLVIAFVSNGDALFKDDAGVIDWYVYEQRASTAYALLLNKHRFPNDDLLTLTFTQLL